MQDFIHQEKRSIRNIPIERQQTSSSSDPSNTENTLSADDLGVSLPPRYVDRKKSNWKRYVIRGSIVGLGLIIVVMVLSSIFSHATVTVYPKRTLANLDYSLTAYLTPTQPNDIRFEVVTIEKELSKEVLATGEELIERASGGSIVVYNKSAEPLLLIKNTRFETPEGLVFRTPSSISIPASTKNSSGEIIPGSVEVEVYADAVGETYNIGLTDFVLPAFREKKDPLFYSVYARSKTPMTGGFAGVVKTATKNDTQTAQEELKTELETSLKNTVLDAVPKGFLPVPETISVAFQEIPNSTGSTDSSVAIRLKGVAKVLAVEESSLAGQIARAFVQDVPGSSVLFEDKSAVVLHPIATTTTLINLSEVDLKVTGVTNLVWQFDAEALAKDIAGKKRGASGVDPILKSYPSIDNADVSIAPVWRRSLPSDPKDINIVIGSKK
jgi:hypothetical protein